MHFISRYHLLDAVSAWMLHESRTLSDFVTLAAVRQPEALEHRHHV
jgi:hypothetical protein